MQSAAFTATLAEISEEHKQRHEAEVAAVMPVVKEVQAANNSFFKSFAVAASVAAVAVAVWQFGPQVKGDSSGMVAEKLLNQKPTGKYRTCSRQSDSQKCFGRCGNA